MGTTPKGMTKGMTKGQIAGTVIGVLAAVALGICLCTYFKRLKDKNEKDVDVDGTYDGEDGDGQPDDDFAGNHPEAKQSAVSNPLHGAGHTQISVADEEDVSST